MYQSLIILHVIAASSALLCGAAALAIPNGTPVHRRWGKGYMASWLFFVLFGIGIDMLEPGVSFFQIFSIAGVSLVAVAYAAVRWRTRFGENWLAHHYIWMVASLVVAWTATLVQVLPRLGITFESWPIFVILQLPPLIGGLVMRRLVQRFSSKAQT